MKAKQLYLILFLFTSFLETGCSNNELKDNQVEGNDPDTTVRNAVMAYMVDEDWNPEFYTVSKWGNALVTKTTVDERYKNIDDSYMGKEIYVVTIADALAAPLIFVDPETLEVIGIMPGE